MSSFRYLAVVSIAAAWALQNPAVAAAEENCLFQLSPPEEDRVLGTSITLQSNYLVVDTCGKAVEAVRFDLITPALERAQAAAIEEERIRRAREEGDRLIRQRDASLRAEMEAQQSAGGWFSWLWRSNGT